MIKIGDWRLHLYKEVPLSPLPKYSYIYEFINRITNESRLFTTDTGDIELATLRFWNEFGIAGWSFNGFKKQVLS